MNKPIEKSAFPCRIATIAVLLAGLLSFSSHSGAAPGPFELRAAYQEQVDRRIDPPAEEVQRYAGLALDALTLAGVAITQPQYVAVVDRDPHVQAIFVYWLADHQPPLLIGASPVSTGRPGEFDHFETPLGVFDHSLANPDFRAEGTRNELGIRGYGLKGMRVFDLGWQQAERMWGPGGISTMRLQMHATDPDRLEQRLGTAQSKGCIRIPATLNRLLDQYGVLDAEYEEEAESTGRSVWMLLPDRTPVADAGRYVIIVDSQRGTRPAWSPDPRVRPRSASTRTSSGSD